MRRLRAIDLFAGAGGLSAGMKGAGIRVVAALEHTPVFAKTHAMNFPRCKTIEADIRQLSPSEFAAATGVAPGEIDLIVGGPPCQTFSTIGVPKIRSLREDVLADPRNYLFGEFLKYVAYFQPTAFLIENVPTMRTRYKGRLFSGLLDWVAELGYEPSVATLNAVTFGVPQSRNRLFVVGARQGVRFEFPEPTYSSGGADKSGKPDDRSQLDLMNNPDPVELLPPRTVYDAISDLPEVWDGCRVDEMAYRTPAPLSAYQAEMRNSSGVVRNNICRMSNERAKRVFAKMRQGDRYMDLPPEVRRILPFREDIFPDRLKRLQLSQPSWTVLAHIGMDGYMYIHPTEHRTLSVREAARIQSFDDSHVFTGNMREQYVQVGNAVPVLLAKAIGHSLTAALR